ncbi:MAG: primosomal protein N' [Nitrospirae bacterium]|nr:primosomal protein N' [Nitrospirota bacterium]
MHIDVLFPIDAGSFTYLVPEDISADIKIGARVLAPFRRSEKVGIVIGINTKPSLAPSIKLKAITKVFDEEPLVPDKLLKLMDWAGQYYISSAGIVLKNALPSSLFTGRKAGRQRIIFDEEAAKKREITLNSAQKKAIKAISDSGPGAFLLHGVTGSGKTEVYIRAIKALPDNKEAIVLVPEIAVTAQMMGNFRRNFGDKVVFYHSGLSDGERLSSWHKMRNGEAKVVLGVRSAVFSPFRNLGIIIVDEEHDASYKQFDGLKYSARDVALVRAQIEGIKIVLGSATPSLESFYNAAAGRFSYLELKERIDERPMPDIEIVDMRNEKKALSFSEKLIEKMKEKLLLKEQALLLLNRRGYAPFLICRDCGYTYRCLICSISLTYHKKAGKLNCHYCGSSLKPSDACPQCRSAKLEYEGTGTEKVEEELHDLIPELKMRRMDRDTTSRKLSHYRMVKDMEDGKTDLLLGTQMIAKGHDLPEVTLAAVISADVAFNLPDFRSAEHAFQLLAQLSGRAGRGNKKGEVLIQTYEPGNYIFDYVRRHDYRGFYEKEIEMRKDLSYPPFGKLIRIVFSFKIKAEGERYMKRLSGMIRKREDAGVTVLGPVIAPIERIKGLWRWHMLLKGKQSGVLRRKALETAGAFKDIKGMKTEIDVDPINMM